MTKICYNVNARNYGSISQIWADSAKWDFVDYKDESRRVETSRDQIDGNTSKIKGRNQRSRELDHESRTKKETNKEFY